MESRGLKIFLTASWVFPFTVPVLSVSIPNSFPKAFLAVGAFTPGLMYTIDHCRVLLVACGILGQTSEENEST